MKRLWVAILLACGGQVDNRYNGATIGQPCTPAREDDVTFAGFDAQDVSVELPSPDADTGVLVCLANHFRGRTSCPYGGTSCETEQGAAVQVEVDAQCTDRRAKDVVTWSCRCANAEGAANDGASYCSCGDGLACVQLVEPVGPTDKNLSGAYCIPTGTTYDAFASCAKACDPNTAPCP